MITRITKENLEGFKNLIPTDLLEHLDEDLYHFLGVVHVEDGKNHAVGVLVFCLEDMLCDSLMPEDFDVELSPEEKEDLSATDYIVSTIKWIMIESKYRGKGYCSELIEYYFECIDDAEIDIAICDVPDDEDYDELVDVLAHWSFAFSEEEIYLYETSLADMARSIASVSIPHGLHGKYKIQSLRNEKKSTFIKIMDLANESTDLMSPDFSRFIDDYEQNLSLIAYKDGKITGALLVHQHKSGTLQPILLKSTSKDTLDSLLLLLIESAKKAVGNYDPDTLVKINCMDEKSAMLVDHLFDDARAISIRRGVSLSEYMGEDENGQ